MALARKIKNKMIIKKVVPSLLIFLLPFISFAQIITSKKEAEKKGIYNKPTAGTTVKADAEKAVAAYDKKSKEVKKPAKAAAAKSKTAVINEQEDKDLIFSPFENYVGMQMINNAMGFLGVRYSGGGTSLSGMDCSGMVTAVFNIFEKKLPRSSNEMAKVGEKVNKDEVQVGDLIFFRTNGRSVINHVGMVVEKIGDEIKFIHSSTSKGVIISSTEEPYYKRTFAQINRVINSI
jgi:cell wall-associated NlpC family hydrolase